MLNDHCHRVSTHLQSINIFIIIIRYHSQSITRPRVVAELSQRRVNTLYEDLDVCGRIILKCMLMNQDGRSWSGFMWLTTGTCGRQFWAGQCTPIFQTIIRISWLANRLSAFIQEDTALWSRLVSINGCHVPHRQRLDKLAADDGQ